VRDIALLGSLPDVVLYAPSGEEETGRAFAYAVEEATSSFVLRLPFGTTRRLPKTPPHEALHEGRGAVLEEGTDVCLVSYGPALLFETLAARELLRVDGIHASVVAMPWLNRVDGAWLRGVAGSSPIVVIEDHVSTGGLGDRVRAELGEHAVRVLGVEGLPLWGHPEEVLAAHGLDAEGIAGSVRSALRGKAA
jgi:transketolase